MTLIRKQINWLSAFVKIWDETETDDVYNQLTVAYKTWLNHNSIVDLISADELMTSLIAKREADLGFLYITNKNNYYFIVKFETPFELPKGCKAHASQMAMYEYVMDKNRLVFDEVDGSEVELIEQTNGTFMQIADFCSTEVITDAQEFIKNFTL